MRAGTCLAAAMLEEMCTRGALGIFATHLHMLHSLPINRQGLDFWRMEVEPQPEAAALAAAAAEEAAAAAAVPEGEDSSSAIRAAEGAGSTSGGSGTGERAAAAGGHASSSGSHDAPNAELDDLVDNSLASGGNSALLAAQGGQHGGLD